MTVTTSFTAFEPRSLDTPLARVLHRHGHFLEPQTGAGDANQSFHLRRAALERLREQGQRLGIHGVEAARGVAEGPVQHERHRPAQGGGADPARTGSADSGRRDSPRRRRSVSRPRHRRSRRARAPGGGRARAPDAARRRRRGHSRRTHARAPIGTPRRFRIAGPGSSPASGLRRRARARPRPCDPSTRRPRRARLRRGSRPAARRARPAGCPPRSTRG